MRRLSKKWQLKVQFNLTDVGCSYCVAKFSNKDDYNHVLIEGPWLIDDHYFTVRFLCKIGSKSGKVIKINKTTTLAKRGRFTRLCIEINLSKSPLSKFWLKGRIWKIQYEGLR
ncbi:Uncharacterized protein RDABS01_015446 [Bienertia sinuspersici]